MPAVGRRAAIPFATAVLATLPLEFDFSIRLVQFTDMSPSGYGHRVHVWGDGGQGPGTEAEIFRYFALWLPTAQGPLFGPGQVWRATFERIS